MERESEITLVDVPVVPVHRVTAENAADQYRSIVDPHHCMGEDLRRIEASPSLSIPLIDDDVGVESMYDMGPERGGRVRVRLDVSSESGAFHKSIALRMLPYKTPDDPGQCFDIKACQATDACNSLLEEHNRYITSLISLFVHHNGCGTSTGHVTLPPPPDNMVLTRIVRLQEVFKDKHAATMLAIRYLHTTAGALCERDYKVEDAVSVANDHAYDAYVKNRSTLGGFRFRMPGSPPASWDGCPHHRDSAGRRVMWARGPNHSFISPDVNVVLAPALDLVSSSDNVETSPPPPIESDP